MNCCFRQLGFFPLCLLTFFPPPLPNRAGASLAVKDTNGSFISTLSMRLFSVRVKIILLIKQQENRHTDIKGKGNDLIRRLFCCEQNK